MGESTKKTTEDDVEGQGSDAAMDSDEFLRAVAHAPDADVPSEASEGASEDEVAPVSERLMQLGQFKILERIGSGGMGTVYRAEDEKLRRVVALKVQRAERDERRRRRFLREARVAASITHPNVATIHEVGEADGRVFIAMELVHGVTLRAKLLQSKRGRLAIEEALRIARDIARGVARAHALGVAHRDLKPDNVMLLDEDESIKVLDFGLAKATEAQKKDGSSESHDDDKRHESVTVTQEGKILGTPGYMSPEQATGRSDVDVRTDVFAIGVILYEMITGKRPFRGTTSMETLIATSRDDHERASKIVPEMPLWIDQVIDRCLEKNPADRYSSAKELLAALEAPRADEARSSRKKTSVYAALIAVALSAVVAWRLLPAASPSPPQTSTALVTKDEAKPTLPANERPTEVVTTPTPASTPAPASSSVALAPPVISGQRVASAVRPARAIPSTPSSAPSSITPAATAPTAPVSAAPGGVIVKSPY